MRIFALESSCDETAAALFDPESGLAGEWIYSQIALHEKHGGVVPELAAREHLRHFAPLIERVRGERISAVAVTRGPGLAPCLALGVAAAKALAMAWDVPLLGVNHLRGHVWSPFIPLHASEVEPDRRARSSLRGISGSNSDRAQASPPSFVQASEGRPSAPDWAADCFPHLALLVSGGHTQLAAVGADRAVHPISSTRDDAAGEALDKGAKLMALGYPGGPLVEKMAAGGDPAAFDFPRGLDRKGELDFSFSGLKTSLRYTLEKLGPVEAQRRLADLCASYQEAVVDALAQKTAAALSGGEFKSLGLSGGVARNGPLRARLEALCRRHGLRFLPVQPDHAGDNAAMIAFAAWMDPAGTVEVGLELGIEPSLGLVERD
jgi:N6-L-threonylcarbamoyladenine synthase